MAARRIGRGAAGDRRDRDQSADRLSGAGRSYRGRCADRGALTRKGCESARQKPGGAMQDEDIDVGDFINNQRLGTVQVMVKLSCATTAMIDGYDVFVMGFQRSRWPRSFGCRRPRSRQCSWCRAWGSRWDRGLSAHSPIGTAAAACCSPPRSCSVCSHWRATQASLAWASSSHCVSRPGCSTAA